MLVQARHERALKGKVNKREKSKGKGDHRERKSRSRRFQEEKANKKQSVGS